MLDANELLSVLRNLGSDFFCGVPDSLLYELNAAIEYSEDHTNIIAANEGSAIGIALGYYLATKKVPVVYMQNSGLGNALNPLISLADRDVYGVPMLLVIGWRAEIDTRGSQLDDEPQHVKQGKVTLGHLDSLDVRYEIIDAETSSMNEKISSIYTHALTNKCPVAIVVRRNTFKPINGSMREAPRPEMTREYIIERIGKEMEPNYLFVSTTGKISRELYELRQRENQELDRDFLCVGGMGHAASISVGIAQKYKKRIVCLDGDGAVIMHMGSLTEVARQKNIIHVVLNNGCHDSVGGQPTCAFDIDLCGVARALNYDNIIRIENNDDLSSFLETVNAVVGSIFVEIICRPGARSDLGRPKSRPAENKRRFMSRIEQELN